MIVAFSEVRPSLELEEMPSSAPLPQLFVVLATLTRSHITRGAKLKTERLSEAASPAIGTELWAEHDGGCEDAPSIEAEGVIREAVGDTCEANTANSGSAVGDA
jgi:hypothetical protein